MSRLTANSIVMIIGFVLIGAITVKQFEAGFYLSLLGAVLHGLVTAFGESTIFGMLKGYPSRLVGAFCSGTGFAGVVGAGLFIALKPVMSDGVIFFIVTPFSFLYFFNLLLLTRRKAKYPFIEENPEAEERAKTIRSSGFIRGESGSVNEDEENQDNVDVASEVSGIEIGDDASRNIPMNWENAKLIFRKAGWYIMNLFMVYFFEYSCITSFADIYANKLKDEAKDNDSLNENSVFIKDGFIVFSFCYQLGVLISRSSLDLVKIRRVEILTFLQFINFTFFLVNTQFFFMKNFYVMYVWMIFVGLMGGCSYVNIMYLMINSQTLKKKEKELSVMVIGISNDMGILLAGVFSLILANTLFKDDV